MARRVAGDHSSGDAPQHGPRLSTFHTRNVTTTTTRRARRNVIRYFVELCSLVPQLASISPAKLDALRDVHRNFTVADAQKIKATEAITNHDVKAVEYFLKVCHR